jgi:hypothetical protein
MRSRFLHRIALPTTLALACSIGLAQTSSSPPDRVEEDWQVVIASPNPVEVGPQITTCMSPVSDGTAQFVAFDLNYVDYPPFSPGGLEAKVYSTSGDVQDFSTQGNQVLQTDNETITWTQRMSVDGDNNVTYTVVNGQSTTWGQFGANNGLDPLSFNSSSVTSLARYSPDRSVATSGVGWQSNRVSQMTLLRVRYYRNGNLVSTDTNSRSVTLSDN